MITDHHVIASKVSSRIVDKQQRDGSCSSTISYSQSDVAFTGKDFQEIMVTNPSHTPAEMDHDAGSQIHSQWPTLHLETDQTLCMGTAHSESLFKLERSKMKNRRIYISTKARMA